MGSKGTLADFFSCIIFFSDHSPLLICWFWSWTHFNMAVGYGFWCYKIKFNSSPCLPLQFWEKARWCCFEAGNHLIKNIYWCILSFRAICELVRDIYSSMFQFLTFTCELRLLSCNSECCYGIVWHAWVACWFIILVFYLFYANQIYWCNFPFRGILEYIYIGREPQR